MEKQEKETKICNRIPITADLYKMPQNPLFSEKSQFRSLVTLLIYAQVHIRSNPMVSTPSKLYALTIGEHCFPTQRQPEAHQLTARALSVFKIILMLFV